MPIQEGIMLKLPDPVEYHGVAGGALHGLVLGSYPDICCTVLYGDGVVLELLHKTKAKLLLHAV